MNAQPAPPTISVIVPVRNSPEYLRACLQHLRASQYKDHEIIVVDDASTDETTQVAEEMGARLVCQERQLGPAAARNRGAEVARGEYLFFVDADVCVHSETISEIADTFGRDPAVDAVFGSYDAHPDAQNVLSQYKNLFHHFVHQGGCEEASTFWAGCGAVRRSVFFALKGFDTNYGRPCIEDIELGVRLHKTGHRILLNKKVQATHLKRWTLWSIFKTDVLDRGIPWTQLILQERALPNDLNLKLSQRVSAVLAYGLLGMLGWGAWHFHGLVLLPILVLLGILMVDWWSVSRRVPTTLRVLAVLWAVATVGMISFYFQMWTLVGLACLLGIILLNCRFYVFFARQRHPLFAALVIPLHVLYFLYSGAAFAAGICLHVWEGLVLGRVWRREGVAEVTR